MSEENRKFYSTIIKLEMEDIKNGKKQMTIGDAEFYYEEWGISTIFKNGKVEFEWKNIE